MNVQGEWTHVLHLRDVKTQQDRSHVDVLYHVVLDGPWTKQPSHV